MTALINEIPGTLVSAWRNYLIALEEVIKKLEAEASALTTMGSCSVRWCLKTEEIISEIDRTLNMIGTSPWADDDDISYVSDLKQLLRGLHASFYTASRGV